MPPTGATTTVSGTGTTRDATSAMAESGVAITSTSTPRAAPATSSSRVSTSLTSHPASASAAASERPALPGPISRTVVTRHLSALQPLTEGAGRSRRSDQYPASLPTTSTAPPAPSRASGRRARGPARPAARPRNAAPTYAGCGTTRSSSSTTSSPTSSTSTSRVRGPQRTSRRRPAAASRRRATSEELAGPERRCRARPRGSGTGPGPAGPPRARSRTGSTPPPRRGAPPPPGASSARRSPRLDPRPEKGAHRAIAGGGCAPRSRRPWLETGGRSLRTATVTPSTRAVGRARLGDGTGQGLEQLPGRPRDDRHDGVHRRPVVGGGVEVVARRRRGRGRGRGRGRPRRVGPGAAPLRAPRGPPRRAAPAPRCGRPRRRAALRWCRGRRAPTPGPPCPTRVGPWDGR